MPGPFPIVPSKALYSGGWSAKCFITNVSVFCVCAVVLYISTTIIGSSPEIMLYLLCHTHNLDAL